MMLSYVAMRAKPSLDMGVIIIVAKIYTLNSFCGFWSLNLKQFNLKYLCLRIIQTPTCLVDQFLP